MRVKLQIGILFACLVLLLGLSATAFAQAYSWVDDEGNVHYGDSIPPEYADQEQRTLRGGVEVDRVDRALTEEEREELRHQEELAREAERAAEMQAERDRRLMSLYGSVDEIRRLRDDRVEGLRSQLRLTASNLENLESDLESVEERIESHEDRGDEPPEHLESRYEDLADQVSSRQQQLLELEDQLDSVRSRFDSEIDRFSELQEEHGR